MHLECFGISHCMHRKQRNQLERDLWRLRPWSVHSANKDADVHLEKPDIHINMLQSSLHTLLRHLGIEDLETLLAAIKSKGRDHNGCVSVSSDLFKGNTMTANRVACQIWRWPNLKTRDILKKIPLCSSDSSTVTCVNPYHWCQLVDNDLHTRNDADHNSVMLKHDLCDVMSETETSGSDSSDKTYWCQLAYWELRERLGQLFPVYDKSVNIFQDIPQGSGLSLGVLYSSKHPRTDKVARLRTKIGTGITISQEEEQVLLYNRSTTDIFVSSFYLNRDAESLYVWKVYKVHPGHVIRVYDLTVMDPFSNPSLADTRSGPTNIHSIYISFSKGWGQGYTRQDIFSCECWLEVILLVNR